jgi:hypothetical protein
MALKLAGSYRAGVWLRRLGEHLVGRIRRRRARSPYGTDDIRSAAGRRRRRRG